MTNETLKMTKEEEIQFFLETVKSHIENNDSMEQRMNYIEWQLRNEFIPKIWDKACAAQMEEVYDAMGIETMSASAVRHWTKTPDFNKLSKNLSEPNDSAETSATHSSE